MSRKPRVWFPSAVYHITKRGNRRSALFYDKQDRLTYLSMFEEARTFFPCILHSYCLMTNHIHLQLETIEHHPQHIMKMLNSRYAVYFNRRHSYEGHLFQGRYRAELILSTDYFLKVSKYIHLNPVEANIVKSPEIYDWSSYNAYISSQDNPHISTSRTLSYFPKPATEKYRAYVEGKNTLIH
ncbi:transposase [Lederbergia citrea]|uniref:transposase n=1 Tax=Lederbergia citrea TaxID=2833581 RepID=UPI001BCA4238|nr:transposase [Lederbergia citrea]MBS4178157.1 transposase [Lederbergia citrea]